MGETSTLSETTSVIGWKIDKFRGAANEDGSPGSSDVPDCEVQGGATITAASYDLVGNRNGCNLTVPVGAPDIHAGDATNPVDPMLDIGINPNGGSGTDTCRTNPEDRKGSC
jgi:hypothetical protein